MNRRGAEARIRHRGVSWAAVALVTLVNCSQSQPRFGELDRWEEVRLRVTRLEGRQDGDFLITPKVQAGGRIWTDLPMVARENQWGTFFFDTEGSRGILPGDGESREVYVVQTGLLATVRCMSELNGSIRVEVHVCHIRRGNVSRDLHDSEIGGEVIHSIKAARIVESGGVVALQRPQ